MINKIDKLPSICTASINIMPELDLGILKSALIACAEVEQAIEVMGCELVIFAVSSYEPESDLYAPVVISIECENNNPSITKLISRISSGNDSDVIEVMGAPFTLYGHRVTLSDHSVVQFGLYPVK